MPPTRRAATASLAGSTLVLTLVLAGCSGSAAGASTDPEQILAGFAATLHTQVDDLLADIPSSDHRLSSDEPITCDDVEHWPQEWHYGVNIQVEGTTDSRPQARAIVERLAADGWHIRDDTWGAPNEVTLVAQRDGYVITILAGAPDARLAIITDSPCVEQDGSIDRREVS